MLPRTWNQRTWLCLPPLTMFLVDISITLLGQDIRYWQGDYSTAIEGNPLAFLILAWHPVAFIIMGLTWGVSISLVILRWHHRLAIVLAFFLTIGHALGAASWLPRHGLVGWLGAVGILVTARLLWAVAWKRIAS